MATQAAEGKKALDANNYQLAADKFTIALKDTQSPIWLIQRSTAYQRLGKHELALADADNAVLVALARQKRELIAQAQFRRAVALHGLKRFGDARLCLRWTRKMDEKMKALGMWQAKVVSDFDGAGGEGAPGNETTVKEYPDKVEEVSSTPVKKEIAPMKEEKGKMPERVVAAAPVVTASPKEKIRHEFYQSNEKLTITVFAKGVPKDKGEVIIKEGSLEISFPVLDSNSTYDLSFDPLFARVDPAKSSYRITPHKIEIILHKSVPGPKWPSLEGAEAIPTSDPLVETIQLARDKAPLYPTSSPVVETVQPAREKGPAYPTSSRHGPKDWDAVASSALKVKKVEDGEEKEVEEDEGETGDPLNDFFKNMYKNANDDTKKAMMKSFQESNGTALSTNWADVKKGPVKTQPPDGVEAKKWEQ